MKPIRTPLSGLLKHLRARILRRLLLRAPRRLRVYPSVEVAVKLLLQLRLPRRLQPPKPLLKRSPRRRNQNPSRY